jgi:UPF0755 protein
MYMSLKKFTPPLWFYFLIFLVLGFSLFIYYHQSVKPVNHQDNNPVTVVIPKGATLDDITQKLNAAGLIRSPLVFKITVSKLGLSRQIQAGSFKFSPAQTTEEIAKGLTKGTSDLWITLLEGWRREEVAEALSVTFLEAGSDFDKKAFLELTEGKEGYLFPDTYLVPVSSTPERIVNLLTFTFDAKITDEFRQALVGRNKTVEQAVIMASLIEREAKTTESRRLVSGILWKRMENDWPLQVDATLQYALGFNQATADWWSPPTAAQKEINSPYNTYKNLGLPPAPIANPSLDSLEAAIFPQDSDYWYYLTGLDGRMYYATTLDEHNQNIANHLR